MVSGSYLDIESWFVVCPFSVQFVGLLGDVGVVVKTFLEML